MVNSSTFYQLNYSEQADLILQEGTFLQSRTEDQFIVDLYELHDLLIEVFYQKSTEELVSLIACNTADKIKSFSGKNLTPRLSIKPATDRFAPRKENYAA